jgi:hypothetical protein
MAKVLVERPRLGSRMRSRPAKGYWKSYRRAMESGDSPPAREGIKASYGALKHFNEHLGPLRRFLNSNVGRPWNNIHSEICERIDRGNVVQNQYVVTQVLLIDGVPCHGEGDHRYGEPIDATWRDRWYVCPKSGLLRRVVYQSRKRTKRKPAAPVLIRISDTLAAVLTVGVPELLTLVPLPDDYHRYLNKDVDVYLKCRAATLTAHQAKSIYGRAVYALSRRPTTRKELLRHPIPDALLVGIRAPEVVK